MKRISWIPLLLAFLLSGCSEQERKSPSTGENADNFIEVPETEVLKSVLRYTPKTSLWTLNDLPYSGFAVSHHPDGSAMEKFGIVDGRKEQEAIQWYPDGHVKNISNYHKGKLHGERRIWSADSAHILIAEFNYHIGKAHGEQKKWYPTGELFKKLNLNSGKEEGIQQAFRKNGVLYANYEAKAGRIFGLKKAALCYGLEDEQIKYEDQN